MGSTPTKEELAALRAKESKF